MEDLTGLGKLAESQLVNQVYNEAGSPAAKELGKLAADTTKTLRLFTAPFQLAALAQDRFQIWLDEARNRVPSERQIEAPSHIAGPALRAMLFMEAEKPLAKMFVNLLSQAIDKDRVGDVHPGFVHILEQISPDEALLLYKMKSMSIAGVNRLFNVDVKDESGIATIESLTTFSKDGFLHPNRICLYFEHLEVLGLVVHRKEDKIIPPKDKPEWAHYRYYSLTEFGTQFLSVCVQDVPASGLDALGKLS